MDGDDEWPISLPIGRPEPRAVENDLDGVKQHLEAWRRVRIGTVRRNSANYRSAAEPVEYPSHWELRNPDEWVGACGDREVRQEWAKVEQLLAHAAPIFHEVLIRRRSLWRGRETAEVIKAAELALEIEPGCAEGRPLRMLSLAEIDTKFLERNSSLVTMLLDVRFDGEVSGMGLHRFLDAATEQEHWLLVADLDGGLLPFRRQRVPSSDLRESPLPGKRLIIVENEKSLAQLPKAPQTIAVLGAGFDLGWTEAGWLRGRDVAYWGDIDTWGLEFLGRARSAIPEITPLLMTSDVFDAYEEHAVPEPAHASSEAPSGLSSSERLLYERILCEGRGRLEQEFLPVSLVGQVVSSWVEGE